MKTRFTNVLAGLLFSISISGCAAVRGKIESGLTELKGSNIESAVSILGYPARTKTFGDSTIYVWERTHEFEHQERYKNTSRTTGTVGHQNISLTTSEPVTEKTEFFCTIQIRTDQNDVILDHDIKGDLIGCLNYASKF